MCNEYGNHVTYDQYIEAFSQLGLPLFVQANGPDLSPRAGIHIRDTAPIIRRSGESTELTELTWAPRDRNKKPVFNFRSEDRRFGKAARCLIPASHFYEFTAAPSPTLPRERGRARVGARKTKWRFTLAGADWFCIAGLVRADAIDGPDCFTMLTTAPGPDVSPYHDRQVAVQWIGEPGWIWNGAKPKSCARCRKARSRCRRSGALTERPDSRVLRESPEIPTNYSGAPLPKKCYLRRAPRRAADGHRVDDAGAAASRR